MRKNKSLEFWRKHWQLWKKSDLNQQKYCKGTKISYHSFRAYSSRFSQEQKQANSKNSSDFYLVPQEKISDETIVPDSSHQFSADTSLKLNLQKGMSLNIPDGFNPKTLYSFFKVVNAL